MTTINDARFLRQLSRLFCCRSVTGRANSRVLAGRTIEIHDATGFDPPDGIEIRIVDAQGCLLGLWWAENEACVVDDHTLLGILAADFDDDDLTEFVRCFLLKHHLINSQGVPTQKKGIA